MTLRNEVMEFIQAYTAMRDVGFKQQRQDLDERRFESNDSYRQAMLEIQQQRLDMELERHQQRQRAGARSATSAVTGGSGTGGSGGGSSRPATALPDGSESYLGSDIEASGGSGDWRTDPDAFTARHDRDGDGVLNSSEEWAAQGEAKRLDLDFSSEASPLPDGLPGADALGGLVDQFTIPNYQQGGLVEDIPNYERSLSVATPIRTSPQTESGPGYGSTPDGPTARVAKPGGMPPAPAAGALPTADTYTPPDPRGRVSGPQAESPRPSRRPDDAQSVMENATRIVYQQNAEAIDYTLRLVNQELAAGRQAVGAPGRVTEVDPATGQGGLTFQEYDAIVQTIDPEGTMPPHVRHMAVLAEVFTTGQAANLSMEERDRLLAGTLMAQMNQSRTLGALALEAFQTGNAESAARLLNDAAARFPTRHNIIVSPHEAHGLTYRVEDFDGNIIEQGKMNTEQTWEAIQGVASGRMFMQTVGEAAQAASEDPLPRSEQSAIREGAQAYADVMALQDEIALAPEDVPEELRTRHAEALSRYQAIEDRATSALDIDRDEFLKYVEDYSRMAVPTPAAPAEGGSDEPGPIWGFVTGLFESNDPEPSDTSPGNPAGNGASTLRPMDATTLQNARRAISAGADRAAVIQRLEQAGFSAEGL